MPSDTAAAPGAATTASETASAARTLPYGEQQGSFMGVIACSNRDDGFFSGEDNYADHLIYTGYRYQCVEYARRFLLLTTGCIFGSCGRATEIYKMDHITHVETCEKYNFVHNDNGKSKSRPRPGDIIIYPYNDSTVPWGHVGVISYADDTRVGIAEQNQFFSNFVSPGADYLDGERCVARYVDLRQNEDGAYFIEESMMPACLGWLSYPSAPRREMIHAPLKPAPEMISVRETPYDSPEHPLIKHFSLPEGIDIPCGKVCHVYGACRGSGQTFVGAVTAATRITRFILQMFFHRKYHSAAFLSLPSNPLNATICKDESTAAVDEVLAALEAAGTEAGSEHALVLALARYFALPVECLEAMRREFSRAELHLSAAATFVPRLAELADGAVAPLPEDIVAENVHIANLPLTNPHDEAWQLVNMDFGTPLLFTELSQLGAVAGNIVDLVTSFTPGHRCFASCKFRMDFGGYLKAVEEQRGPRTAFTIVLCENMDGLQRELVTLLQGYCEGFKYPVRVIAEVDLHYAGGKLFAHPTEASPEIASPTTISPLCDYEVNFALAMAEWGEILGNKERHSALYEAALSPEADVVFAKPLWSHLCSGSVADLEGGAAAARGPETQRERSLSLRFFDIARRLFELALPSQAAESWDQEVSEYKGSCRRIHMSKPVKAELPLNGLVGTAAVINFGMSAMMGFRGYSPVEALCGDGHATVEPVCVAYMFPTDND